MTNKVIVEVEMLDSKKSLNNLDQSAKRANKTLERTKELMAGTKGGGGTKSASAAFGQTEYNTARGTVGTGAAGRDFSKQSRELGGLVRLYATYAATLYATEAAFRALSQAMDTTNMIEGLNQLGAVSGVAMGGLAKRFSEASGGAISLRESMEATAKAVSSGLSQAQFLKLGEVAKRASQALGVNMSDAVSRLTRGITKLEPELLDELGIFTKLGKATEDYARVIGKPVSALTDFERRQAFANAVLEEGARKFGQIQIETNPYDKLLATLKNVSQAGLEIINTVLAPFAKLLSNNTGLLVGAVALIGAKIVKDALPAIGEWRTGLKAAADAARKSSSDISASFGEGFVERTNAAFKVPQLEANLKKSEEAYRASRAKMATMDSDLSKRVLKGGEGTDEKSLRSQQSRVTREINKLKADGLAIDNAQIVALERQKATIIALKNDLKSLAVAKNASLDKAESGGGSMFERIGDWLRASSAKGARDKSTRLDILENVSKNQTEKGFGSAIGTMMKELDALPGKFQKVRTGIAGIVIAGAGSVGTAISGLSRFLGPVGIGLAVLQAALPLFRSNEEAAARFSGSLDLLKENAENAFRVLERLSKLDPLERISLDSLDAKATALESLGTSLTKAFNDFETELAGRNWADSTVNFLASIIGRSSEQLLAKQVTSSIEKAVMLAGSSQQSTEIKDEIGRMLGLNSGATFAAINTALADATPQLRAAVSQYVEDAGKKAKASTGSFKAFRDGLAESGKVYQDLINTTKNSTPLTKFAEDSTKKLLELDKILSGGTLLTNLIGLREVSKDINFLQLFPIEAAKNILDTSNNLNNLSEDLAEVESRQSIYNAAIERQKKLIEETKSGIFPIFADIDNTVDKAKASIAQLEKLNAGLNSTREGIKGKFESAAAVFTGAMRQGLITNIETFTEGLRVAAAKAGLEIKKAALGGVVDEEQKIKLQGKIDQASFALEKQTLDMQGRLLKSNLDLKIAVMENTLAQTVANSGMGQKPGENDEMYKKRLKAEQDDIQSKTTTLDSYKRTSTSSLSANLAELKNSSMSRGGSNPALMQGIALGIEAGKARDDLNAQYKTLGGKQEASEITKNLSLIDARGNKRLKTQAEGEALLALEFQTLERQKATMSDAEYLAKKAGLDITKEEFNLQKAEIQASIILEKAQEARKNMDKDEAAKNIKNSEYLAGVIKSQAAAQAESTTLTATQAVNVATSVAAKQQEIDKNAQLDKTAGFILDSQIASNKEAQDLLATKDRLGEIDSESLKKQLDILKVEELKLDQTKQLTAAQVAYRQEIEKLDQERVQAGGNLTGQKAIDNETSRARALQNFEAQKKGILGVTEAQIKSAEVLRDTTTRQQTYVDLFKQGFKGMEDAIVNFTKTGKLSFKDMINSFIEGLLRYEIQQQQIALFSSMGGAGGLAKMFISAFSMTPASRFNMGGGGADPLDFVAKGGVYDAGLKTFAKGGMFTNSIVNQPTLFKFAKGTGMMGEAGPEAIMPLKRDNNGNLGVRSGGGSNVDVVVNNYGNEKATTKETMDSRGNRRIEVMIGDMVAGELNRVGSTTQQAMTSSYGTSPLVARR
jgi:lambda family phage tail tape measure protein